MTMLLLAMGAVADDRWVGTATSLGGEPLDVAVTEIDGRLLVEVHWPTFGLTTLERTADATTCDDPDLVEGEGRVGVARTCLDARLPDRHPVYDFESRTRVRCVIGEEEAACKLGYTPWFDLRRVTSPG